MSCSMCRLNQAVGEIEVHQLDLMVEEEEELSYMNRQEQTNLKRVVHVVVVIELNNHSIFRLIIIIIIITVITVIVFVVS